MFKELTKVFGETVIYGLTGVASTLASIFLIPIYTRILTPVDYGVSALIGTLFSIISVIANMGMSSAIFWAYFKAKENEKKTVIGTSFVFQTITPLLIASGAFLFSRLISRTLFGEETYSNLVALAAAAMFFNVSTAVSLATLRARGEPSKYVAINLAGLLVTIISSLVLVVGMRLGLLGMFLGNLAGAFVMYLSGLATLLPKLHLVFSRFWIREMLKFGAPMMPAGLAMWALNSSDRYFLNAFASTADVGIYNVGYKVGALVNLLVSALQLAYPRFVFSIYNEKENPQEYFRKIITYFYLMTFSLALVVSIFSKEAVQLLTGSAFHGSYIVVPFIAFSYVGLSLYYTFATGVFVVGKTFYSTVAVLVGGGSNLLINYFLISRFGMMGAALSTLVSFLLLAIAELYFSQRFYPIKIELRRLLTVAVVGGALAYIASIISFGFLLSLLAKTLLVVSFPLVLYLLGFFEERELKKLLQIWSIVKKSRFNPRRMLDGIRQDLVG